MKGNLSKEQLISCYDIVFDQVHSGNFKSAEMSDLLYTNDYWFNTKPRQGWRNSLEEYLNSIGAEINLKHLDKYGEI